MGHRTSRRRTSRRGRKVVPNERLWVTDISPLDYTPLGMGAGSVKRVALVDTEAPPIPTPVSTFFKERYDTKVRLKSGAVKQLKKPKLVDPGAPRNTVAFIDYTVYGDADNREAYIFYMATRADMRERGYGRDLLERFMLSLQSDGVRYVNFGKVVNRHVWTMMSRWVDRHQGGSYTPHVRGKYLF